MKLRKVLLSLSLAGICLSQASAQEFPGPNSEAFPAARHIGDGVRSIGDTNRVVSTMPDLRPETFVPPDEPVAMASMEMSMLAPTACASAACDTDCDIPCDTGCAPACPPAALGWFGAETLLWFSEGHRGPTVTAIPLPVGPPAVNVTPFGNTIGTGLLPGYRVQGGIFLGEDQTMAVGGRVFGIYNNGQNQGVAGNGNSSWVPGVQLPAFVSASAATSLDMVGAEASFHYLIASASSYRVDMLAGYTYNHLDSTLGLTTTSVDLPGNIFQDGVFTHTDGISATNQFHGGHFGIESTVHQNKLSVTTLAKLSFGNMRQSVTTSGSNIFVPTAGAPTTAAGGLFATAGNVVNNKFSFIPEFNMKLGYDVSENVRITAGYTFILWEAAAMAGDQINGGALPVSTFGNIVDNSFWMQGLDLGAVLSF